MRRRISELLLSLRNPSYKYLSVLWLINSLLVRKRHIDKILWAKIDLKSTRICTPKPFSFESLRSGESDGSDWRSFEKWLRNYFDLFYSQLTLSNVDELSCRVEFLRSISNSSSEGEKVFSPPLYVLHKAWTLGTLRRGRAVTARKCTNKRDAHEEMLFCLLKLVSVFTHVANSYENLLPQKKAFTWKKKEFNSHDRYWFLGHKHNGCAWRTCVQRRTCVMCSVVVAFAFVGRAHLRCNVIWYSQLRQNRENKTSLTMDL